MVSLGKEYGVQFDACEAMRSTHIGVKHDAQWQREHVSNDYGNRELMLQILGKASDLP